MNRYLQQLIKRYPQLTPIENDIQSAYNIIADSFTAGNKLLIAGNGGSASDAEHIVGELMKSFVKKREFPEKFVSRLNETDSEIAEFLIPRLQPALPAIALTGQIALSTAVVNDIDGSLIFAQQVCGYGKEGDVLLCISSTGNAKNLLYAAAAAKAKSMKVIALTGGNGGKLKVLADVSIIVPETETYKVQELHLPVYHCLCMMLEECFFEN